MVVCNGLGVQKSVGSTRTYDYSKICTIKDEDVPVSYKIKNIPYVLDQDIVGSCVAHGLAENLQANHFKNTGEMLDLSVLEIYGLWRGDYTGDGMYVQTALDEGRKIGTIPRRLAPENIEVPDAIKKAKEYQEMYPDAFVFKIGSYFEIRKNVNFEKNLKKAIMQFDLPVIIVRSTGSMLHCEIAIGWDEEGIILQNSWGREWGDNGTHHYKAKNLEEAYVVIMDDIKIPFTDVDEHWAEKYIRNLYFANIIDGYEDGTFRPEEHMKRSEVAKMVDSIMQIYDDKIHKLEERIKELR